MSGSSVMSSHHRRSEHRMRHTFQARRDCVCLPCCYSWLGANWIIRPRTCSHIFFENVNIARLVPSEDKPSEHHIPLWGRVITGAMAANSPQAFLVPLKLVRTDTDESFDMDLWIDGSYNTSPSSSTFCFGFLVRPPPLAKAKIASAVTDSDSARAQQPPQPKKRKFGERKIEEVKMTHRVTWMDAAPKEVNLGDFECELQLPMLQSIQLASSMHPAKCVRERMEWELDPAKARKAKAAPKVKVPFSLS